MPAQVDLPRLKDGRVGGAFWSAFVLCPKNGTDFSDANYAEGQSPTCYMLSFATLCESAFVQYHNKKAMARTTLIIDHSRIHDTFPAGSSSTLNGRISESFFHFQHR